MSEEIPDSQNSWPRDPVYKQSYNDPTYGGGLKPWTEVYHADTTDQLKLPPPPPPPPLPPDEPIPPPPPDAPSPPPLPSEPPPGDERSPNLEQTGRKGHSDLYAALRSSPDLSDDLDKEEAQLRAQLLKSLAARKMKEKMEKLKNEVNVVFNLYTLCAVYKCCIDLCAYSRKLKFTYLKTSKKKKIC